MSTTIMHGPDVARALNDLARHQLIERLLSDVLFDMKVCEIEGWDRMEFPRMLKVEIDRMVRE